MSITNRHPLVKNMLNKLDFHNRLTSKWNIIFLETKKIEPKNIQIKNYFYLMIIKYLDTILTVDKVFIYTRQNLHTPDMFSNIIGHNLVTLVELPIGLNYNSISLFVLKKSMEMQSNIIFFSDDYGYVNLTLNDDHNRIHSDAINTYEDDRDLFTDDHIHAKIIKKNVTDDDYVLNQSFKNNIPIEEQNNIVDMNDIMDKFCLDSLICPNVFIIPFTKINLDFINYAFTISNSLQSQNNNFSTMISLTVSSIKKKINIKDATTENIISITENKSIYNKIRELSIIKDPNFNTKLLKNLIPYDHSDYLYYPCMDLDMEPYICDPSYEFLSHTTTNMNNMDNFHMPFIFNTNGFEFKPHNNNSIYSFMFRRFDKSDCGLFIRKCQSKTLIPKILHHFWLLENPVINYSNLWSRILREPWSYIIWTEEKLINEFGENNWFKLYNNESNYNAKLIISYLMVLEKYGGVAIDSYSIPLRLITDDFLSNKCVVCFSNESDYNINLSHRMIALVPGTYIESGKKKDYDAARRPFEGINPFFRDIYRKNKEKLMHTKQNPDNKNEPISYPELYDMIYRNFSSSGQNKLESLKNILLNDSNVIIYPSYYFDPNIEFFPKKLAKLAFSINLWKSIVIKDIPPPTELKRTHKITQGAMIARLKENPRDRLLNERRTL